MVQWIGLMVGAITLVLLIFVLWIAAKSAKELPKGKSLRKLSNKELKKRLRG